jgi:predicted DNA-binding protein
MKKNIRRYSLILPDAIYKQLDDIADEKGTTMAELIRRFVALGLMAMKMENDPDSELLLRTGEKTRAIILL